ncbi:diguanylate cyclase [Bacillus sp. AFS002410]|uniref:diguanylate cyclase n=1 Tax=Bacillus sp. AFS002410 TaxID=2033481 RepID=UPI0015CF12F8|nr:diguanylate cyclase [Bacillus sp. AFS002410]
MKTLRMILVMLIAMVFVGLSFIYFIKSDQTRFTNSFQNDFLKISLYTKDSAAYVNMLSLFSKNTLEYGTKKPVDISYLTTNQKTNTFSADTIGAFQTEKGNITGIGSIDKPSTKKRELELAEELNPYFAEAYHSFPNIAWIYYTSASGFMNLYPFVPSSDYTFSKDSLKGETFKMGTIKENPNRSVYWSRPYLDRAGKGMMVTVCAPVDANGLYIGTISIDLTFQMLSKQLSEEYSSILADGKGDVIASSVSSFLSQNKLSNISQLDSFHPKVFKQLVQKVPSNQLKTIHGVQVIKKDVPGTDWTFYYVLTQREKIHQISVKLGIVVLFTTLVLWIFWIAEKRKLAENKLKALVNELADDNSELHALSIKDSLTGVFNRRGIEQRIQLEVNKNEQQDLSFILFDIDSFKQINDCYGHSIGDFVLKESANVIGHSIRVHDAIGRWGGEEFILILAHTGYEHALDMAERLRQNIASHSYEIEGKVIPVTITFGVSVYNPKRSVKECIDRADQAMYKGKQNGKNQVVGENDL